MELDEEEDENVIEWFYEHKGLEYSDYINGPSYRRWRLPVFPHLYNSRPRKVHISVYH
jgi:hypothetical protein